MILQGYECVIGIEVHAQMNTKTKLFCSCSTQFQAGDNENTCPVCMGMPGALPVLNDSVLDSAIKTGLSLNCEIDQGSVFARKNYFYPDLPKGYQISQYDQPICKSGYVDIVTEGGERKRIFIERAHLEEDAGKSLHHGNHSLVNYNRSSNPLLEIVSGPDLRSPSEASSYVKALRAIVQYIGVCDGNLEEGSMRADCNISVRKKGETALGTKVELKNLNSFRFIEKALQFEFERQVDAMLSGEKINQETRLYDKDKNKTYAMRSKEDAHDYRYFPEPDLLNVEIDDARIESLKKVMPELPLAMADRFIKEYKIPEYDAVVLTQSRELAKYYEDVAARTKNYKASSNWIMTELLRELNEAKLDITESPIGSENLAEMIALIDDKTISGKMAKSVFSEMWQSSRKPAEIVKEKGLVQISDEDQIIKIIEEIKEKSPKQLEEYKAGKEKLFGFFVGQCMKATKGQANPEVLNKLLKANL